MKVKLNCPNLMNLQDLDFANSPYTIEFDSSIVIGVHDANIEGIAVIIFESNKVSVVKSEELHSLMKEIVKNQQFEKGYTRFGTFEQEMAGIAVPFSQGNRHLAYYKKDKYPIIDGFKDDNINYKLWGNLLKLES